MEIITRAFNKVNDSGFIFDTLPKGVYFMAFYPIHADKKTFFDVYYAYLKTLLEYADIKISCAKDDTDFIIGYSIIANDTLEWVYVKHDYRKQGIAKHLIKNKKLTGINENNLTKLGHEIMKNHHLFKQQKEEPNEQNVSEVN